MRKSLAAAIAALTLPLVGCSSGTSSEPTVVASFYPLEFVAKRIVGDHARVTTLAVPGAEAHDLDLTPKQVAEIGSAAVVFYESNLQPAVDQVIKNDKPKQVVDAASLVTLEPGAKDAHEHEGEHEAEHEAEHEEGHTHGTLDPHFWLDPTLLAKAAEGFAKAMGTSDPKNKASYEANAAKLVEELNALDGEFKQGLANCQLRSIVVSHDAFNYLGRRYDLTIHPIAGLAPDAEPSPKYLKELTDLIKTEKITTVFHEEIASTANAEALAKDTGVTNAVLDPIEGVKKGSSANYIELMQANLAALRKANSCQ